MRKLRTSCGILQFGHVINNRGLADMVNGGKTSEVAGKVLRIEADATVTAEQACQEECCFLERSSTL